MKVNVTQMLSGLNGEQVLEMGRQCDACGHVPSRPVGLRSTCINALLHPENAKNVDGETQLKRWKLAQKVNDNDEVELSTEEVVDIKRLIAAVSTPVVTGPAWLMLEGKYNEDRSEVTGSDA